MADSLRGDIGGLLERDAVALGRVDVFVDLSLTMRPYLTSTESPFRTLLTTLDNRLGNNISLRGFGFEGDPSRQTVTLQPLSTLLDAQTYGRVNNDYAALFAGFSGVETTHLVITDGVQSDQADTRGQYGPIVRAAEGWVRRGGVFATLLYRTPYAGTYYPEASTCAARQTGYDCPDRPLVVYAFAPSGEALDQLLRMIDSTARPEQVVRLGVRIGGAYADVRPVYEATPEDAPQSQGERPRRPRPTVLLRDSSTVIVPGFAPIPTGRVNARAADANGFVPLQFDVVVPAHASLWGGLAPEEARRLLEAFEPTLEAWEVNARGDSTSVVPLEVFQRGARVEVLASGAAARGDSAFAPGAVVARVTVPVQRPRSEGRLIAWVLTLRAPTATDALVPTGYSTDSDCASGECPRTLQLQPMLGAILREHYVPGRLLFLTQWPG